VISFFPVAAQHADITTQVIAQRDLRLFRGARDPARVDPAGVRHSRRPVDTQAWKPEAEHILEHFQTFHRHLPAARLRELYQELAARLG
jgi:hypothetical protein